MGLFQPRWMHKDDEKALAFVEKLQDEKRLLAAALESPHEKVCITAAQKLKTDDARMKVLTGTNLQGVWKDRIRKEMVSRLQDKSRLVEYMSDPDLIIRFFSLKYNGKEKEAFETLKKASDQGEDITIECFLDDLSSDEMCSLLVTTQCNLYYAHEIIKKLKKTINSRKDYENALCDVALQTENGQIRFFTAGELKIKDVTQKYDDTMLARKLEREEREREQRQKELEENKKRFFRGEDLQREESNVVNNLTVEEIKNAGLTNALFEKLYKHADNQFIIDVLVGVGEAPAVKDIIDTYLISWLNEKDEYNTRNMGDHTSSAARILTELYRNGVYADVIKAYDGKILQWAGKMPVFDMSDPMGREMASGYTPDPEIRFDLKQDNGLRYVWGK